MSFDSQRVEQIVSTALAMPVDERMPYLDAACGDDAALRAWVEALLKAREEAAVFSDQPTMPEDGTTDPGATDEASPPRLSSPASPELDSTRSDHASDEDYSLDFLAPSSDAGVLGHLAHYEVLEVLGKGGFGIVLKAFDEKLHRIVAIKVLAPQLAASGTARRRFIREARAAAAVRHEHVIDIHAVDEQPVPYLVMEYVAGSNLQEKLDQSAPLELKEILRIGCQIAGGLAAAHRQGLVHRDIKPGNILLENGVERVKITDFGLARAVDDATLTQSGVVAGTPAYMAPEQAMGEALDHRADLFSLGTVLYVMCTGRPPFRAGGTIAILKRVCEDVPRPIREINPEIPQWLADIIAKLHAKRPEDRYQSAKEVADLLAKYLAEIQTHGQVISTGDPTERAASDSRRAGDVSPPSTAETSSTEPGTAAPQGAGAPRSSRSRSRRHLIAMGLIALGALVAVLAYSGKFEGIFYGSGETRTLPKTDKTVVTGTAETEGWVQLFNGKDLTGWTPSDADKWKVEKGTLVGAARAHLVSDQTYQNFHLRAKARYNRAAMGTIAFRGFSAPNGDAIAHGEVTLGNNGVGKTGSAHLWFNPKPENVADFAPELVPADTWFDLEIIVRGKEIIAKVNGTTTASITPERLPERGRISLNAYQPGSVIEFSKLEIKELPPTEPSWVQLFNGQDLTGWKTHPDQPGGWTVEEGQLVGRSKRVHHLFSERGDYADFHLRAEVMINKDGNSGIYFRAPFALRPAYQDLPFPTGYEAQILNSYPEPGAEMTGSIIGRAKVAKSPVAPDTWLTLEIIARGDDLAVKVNGQVTAQVRDQTHRRGHLVLQAMSDVGIVDQTTVVRFKKIEIKELQPGKPSESLIAGWGQAIDPQGDCRFEVNQGRLALTVPAGDHDLNPAPEKNLLAPRVFQEIEGDFTLQVHVRPFALPPRGIENFHAAGLVVWQDGQNYLRLLRAAGLQFFTQAEWWQEGSHGGADGPDAAHLQVQRQGSVLRLRTSNDGKTWADWKTVDLKLSSKVQLGVAAVNTGRESCSFEFENLPSQPLVSAGPPPAVAPFDERKAKAHQEAWAKHLGVDVEITNSLDMKLRLIPPGEFLRGTPTKERETMLANLAQDWQKGFVREERQAERASVAQPFYLATTEVTVGQFRKFVKARSYKTTAETNGRGGRVLEGASIEYRPESTWQHETVALSDDHPVVQLSLKDAQEFCHWLSQRDGRTYAMPTEDQWEWACRGGTETPWFSGTEVAGVADVAWTTQNADGTSHPVARKKANPFGLFDLLGNTEELTTSALGVPVSRGGSFGLGPELCRAASRVPVPIEETYYARGFRVAVVGDLQPKTPKLSDMQQLQGRWKLVSVEPDPMSGWIVFSGDKFTSSLGQGAGQQGTFRLNPSAQPKEIDFIIDGIVGANTIYELDGNKLTILQSVPGSPRPKTTAKREPRQTVYRYEREMTGETNPFIVLAKDAKPERRFASLAEAVTAAQSSDTIEIRGDGPFVSAAIVIRNKDLVVRAATAHQPVIKLDATAKSLFNTNAALTLEGLELQGTRPAPEERWQYMVHSDRAAIRLANCRVLAIGSSWAGIRAENSPLCEIINCQFLGENMNGTLDWTCPGRGKAVVRNCQALGGEYWFAFHYHEDPQDVAVELSRNTAVVTRPPIMFFLQSIPTSLTENRFRLRSSNNVLQGKDHVLGVVSPPVGMDGKEITPEHRQRALQALVAWTGQENLYGQPAELVGGVVAPAPRNLEEWRTFWKSPEMGSLQEKPKFAVGEKLLSSLATTPEQIKLQDFALDAATYGEKARIFGANPDFVGPGAAYQRWRQTAEYQEWLKRTGQPPRGKETAQPLGAVAPFDEKQAKERQEAWAKHLGVDVETTNPIGMKLRLIPPGEFTMGSSADELKAAALESDAGYTERCKTELPSHRVKISRPILLGATEVTVGEFKKFIEATGHKTQTETDGGGLRFVGGEQGNVAIG